MLDVDGCKERFNVKNTHRKHYQAHHKHYQVLSELQSRFGDKLLEI